MERPATQMAPAFMKRILQALASAVWLCSLEFGTISIFVMSGEEL
jgi:hypothetical protein